MHEDPRSLVLEPNAGLRAHNFRGSVIRPLIYVWPEKRALVERVERGGRNGISPVPRGTLFPP